MTTVRITIETIGEGSDVPMLRHTCEVPLHKGENRFFNTLDHKATYTAFQFWKDLRKHFKKELSV